MDASQDESKSAPLDAGGGTVGSSMQSGPHIGAAPARTAEIGRADVEMDRSTQADGASACTDETDESEDELDDSELDSADDEDIDMAYEAAVQAGHALAAADRAMAAQAWPDALTALCGAVQAAPHVANEVGPLVASAAAACAAAAPSPTDAVQIYMAIAQVWPRGQQLPAAVLAGWGAVLAAAGRPLEALTTLQLALAVDPTSEAAMETIRAVSSALVHTWHFRMLNDAVRNAAYAEAIAAVAAGRTVLDIGAGTGLLSMMAARSGATTVTAVEMSPVMAKLAAMTIQANGLGKRIRLLCASSNALQVPRHLQAPVDLVISEILDTGLLGERVIPALTHAMTHLAKPDARCIPCGARVFVQLVECDLMAKQGGVHESVTVCGHKLVDVVRLVVDEPYSCEQLAWLPHKPLSEPQELTTMRFGHISPPLTIAALTTRVTQGGTVHCIAVWWDLFLDEERHISTAPASHTCWDQAMFYMPQPLTVAAGDDVQLHATVHSDCFEFRIQHPTRSSHSIMCNPDIVRTSVDTCFVAEADMRVLNDHVSRAAYAAATRAIPAVKSAIVLSEGWDLLPMDMAAAGCQYIDAVVAIEDGAFTHLTSTKDRVMEPASTTLKLHKVGPGTSFSPLLAALASQTRQLIVMQPVEPSGLLRQHLQDDCNACLQLFAPSGVSLSMCPSALTVMARLVHCPMLLDHGLVDPKNVPGFDVSAVSRFWINSFQDMDVDHVPHSPLSPDVATLQLSLNVADGLRRSHAFPFVATGSGAANAVVYWFVQYLHEDSVMLSTGPSSSCPRGTRWLQAAHLFSQPVAIVAGQSYTLHATCSGSMLRFDVQAG